MKKWFFSLITLMAMTFATVTLASCGDDDDEGNVAGWMVGTWNECNSSGTVYNETTSTEMLHMTFNSNGTGRWWATNKGNVTDWYEFRFSGSGTDNSVTGTITVTSSSNSSRYPVGASESGTITLSDKGIMHTGAVYYKKAN